MALTGISHAFVLEQRFAVLTSPEYSTVIVNPALRAGEIVWLVACAYVLDMPKHPQQNTIWCNHQQTPFDIYAPLILTLCQSAEDTGNQLCNKQCSPWDLHVQAKLRMHRKRLA